ncbi:uncharacterized protein LOC136074134 [Hydra vulgaris]|uniref:Uncharacterized protein LOC136074134 n=1 Tax=Hydra vulgaris TaxID=6087 RepID=A0ABM4B143_HYDVU
MDKVIENPEFQIKLSELLVEDWFEIGICLKVKHRSLNTIKSDFMLFQKQKDKAYEMIKKWFNYDENPTFEKLKLAILKIEKTDLLKEVKDLADEFLNESLNSTSNTSERNALLNSGGFSTMPSVLPEDVSNTGGLSTMSSVLSADDSNKVISARLESKTQCDLYPSGAELGSQV